MFCIKQSDEMINKTFRLPVKLVDELTEVAEDKHVSVNSLVRQCCEYALSNLPTDNKEETN